MACETIALAVAQALPLIGLYRIIKKLRVRHLKRASKHNTSNVSTKASHLSHFQGTIFRVIIVGVTKGLIMAACERLVSLNRGPEGDKYGKLEFCRFVLKRHSFQCSFIDRCRKIKRSDRIKCAEGDQESPHMHMPQTTARTKKKLIFRSKIKLIVRVLT